MPERPKVIDASDDASTAPLMDEATDQFLDAMDEVWRWLPEAYYENDADRETVAVINAARQLWIRGMLLGLLEPDFAREALAKMQMLDEVNYAGTRDTIKAIREREAALNGAAGTGQRDGE